MKYSGRERDLEIARQIVASLLPLGHADVYLFGSSARGDARRFSDLDIGILPRRPLPPAMISTLREALAESSMLIDADIVDLAETGDEFRTAALRDAQPWIV